MKKLIVKLAYKTISRTSFFIFLFYFFGAVLLHYSITEYKVIYIKNHRIYQITAVAEDTVSINEILKINGIKHITPVIITSGSIYLDNYQLDVTVNAVDPSYLSQFKLSGNLFPSNSNMPYLLVNSALLENFRNISETPNYNITSNKSCLANLDINRSAVICGIIVDNLSTPQVYMSYNTAKSFLATQDSQNLWISLDINDNDKVINELIKKNLKPSYDLNLVESWKSARKECILTALSSFCFFLCSTILLIKDYHLECFIYSNERYTLLSCGLTKEYLRFIYIIRASITLLYSLIASSIISWWISCLSFLSLLVSTVFAILCLAFTFVSIK